MDQYIYMNCQMNQQRRNCGAKVYEHPFILIDIVKLFSKELYKLLYSKNLTTSRLNLNMSSCDISFQFFKMKMELQLKNDISSTLKGS